MDFKLQFNTIVYIFYLSIREMENNFTKSATMSAISLNGSRVFLLMNRIFDLSINAV